MCHIWKLLLERQHKPLYLDESKRMKNKRTESMTQNNLPRYNEIYWASVNRFKTATAREPPTSPYPPLDSATNQPPTPAHRSLHVVYSGCAASQLCRRVAISSKNRTTRSWTFFRVTRDGMNIAKVLKRVAKLAQKCAKTTAKSAREHVRAFQT